jgi:hypothetical protein
MRRIVIVVPDLLGTPEDESALRQKLSALEQLAERGTIVKLASLPRIETPEALYLGMVPTEAQMRQGPLTVSALGADPPERSTHFHVSLMSCEDGIARNPGYLPTSAELDIIWTAAKRLNTPQLTLVKGEALDHGLVWEAFGDLGTTTAAEVADKNIAGHLPEGDGDRPLRRLIDDSVNLLAGLHLNERRLEEGLPPLDLLWPWGHGVRLPVPRLILRRGEPATVESSSLRLAGLTRLTGYRHEDRARFGQGLSIRFNDIARRALARNVSVIVIEAFRDLRAAKSADERAEEFAWLARELDARLLAPIAESLAGAAARVEPMRLAFLAPSTDGDKRGLGLDVRSDARSDNPFPFDERALDERLVPTYDLASRVDDALTS